MLNLLREPKIYHEQGNNSLNTKIDTFMIENHLKCNQEIDPENPNRKWFTSVHGSNLTRKTKGGSNRGRKNKQPFSPMGIFHENQENEEEKRIEAEGDGVTWNKECTGTSAEGSRLGSGEGEIIAGR